MQKNNYIYIYIYIHICILMSVCIILEVGGSVQPGNRFVSFVRASERSCLCAREALCFPWGGVRASSCARVRARTRALARAHVCPWEMFFFSLWDLGIGFMKISKQIEIPKFPVSLEEKFCFRSWRCTWRCTTQGCTPAPLVPLV